MFAQANVLRSNDDYFSDELPYWEQCGLRCDPFATTSEINTYYAFPQWEEYLDLLQHLSRHNNVLLTVIGQPGIGKTTLMNQFLVEAINDFHPSEAALRSNLAPGEFWVLIEDTIRTCQVKADRSLDSERLLDLLVEGFDLPWQSAETLQDQFDAQLENFQRCRHTCLLLVDDAHLLPKETLQSLLYLINQQSEAQMQFHVLLFGNPTLKPSLEHFAEQKNAGEITCTLELKPLSRDQTERYLQHRLTKAGLQGPSPFSPAQLGRIWKQSKGIPAQVNRIAQQTLCEMNRETKNGQTGIALKAWAWLQENSIRLASGLLVLLALYSVVMFLWQHQRTRAGTHTAKKTAFTTLKPRVSLLPALPAEAYVPAPTAAEPTADAATLSPVSYVMRQSDHSMVMPWIAQSVLDVDSKPATPSPATSVAPPSLAVELTAAKSAMPTSEMTSIGQGQAMSGVKTAAMTVLSLPQQAQVKPPVAVVPHPTIVITEETQELNHPLLKAEVKPLLAPAPQEDVMHKLPAVSTKENLLPVASLTPTSANKKSTGMSHSTQPSAVYSSHEKQLLRVPSGHYTLQLVGVSQKDSIHQLIKTHQLENKASYFHTYRNGKDWYVLVYGHYSTPQQALAAKANLPKLIQDLKPWARPLASVHQAIRDGAARDEEGEAAA